MTMSSHTQPFPLLRRVNWVVTAAETEQHVCGSNHSRAIVAYYRSPSEAICAVDYGLQPHSEARDGSSPPSVAIFYESHLTRCRLTGVKIFRLNICVELLENSGLGLASPPSVELHGWLLCDNKVQDSFHTVPSFSLAGARAQLAPHANTDEFDYVPPVSRRLLPIFSSSAAEKYTTPLPVTRFTIFTTRNQPLIQRLFSRPQQMKLELAVIVQVLLPRNDSINRTKPTSATFCLAFNHQQQNCQFVYRMPKCLLSQASEYFRILFQNDIFPLDVSAINSNSTRYKENKDCSVQFDAENMDFTPFQMLMQFIAESTAFNIVQLTLEQCAKLYVLADRFQVPALLWGLLEQMRFLLTPEKVSAIAGCGQLGASTNNCLAESCLEEKNGEEDDSQKQEIFEFLRFFGIMPKIHSGTC